MALPTKAKLDRIRIILEKHLKAAAEEAGIKSASLGTITYSETGFHAKLSGDFKLDEAEQAKADARARETLEDELFIRGIDKKLAVETFSINGKQMKLLSFKRTNALAEAVDDGARYNVRISALKFMHPAPAE